ncbi:hypothetical protein JR316_0006790 [Psilocybe cubensis]|uniref:Uncharacterized protein n=2 Tax=Psilocybe cubensis TaxID=181762 RepID=A0ACB8GXT9_PSICU|nr:hypothetical protein JR316_0006790 [Psilocybe cubensis]KAH9480192.1 hypothetical protein JR316_0006790 [Psilocybe cubensis]
MASHSGPVHTHRLITLILSVIFSIIVMGLLANITHRTLGFRSATNWQILGLVISSLTILVFPLMLVASGAIHVITELILTMILFIVWVVSSAMIIHARRNNFGGVGCGFFRFFSISSLCSQLTAAEAFSIIIWILLLFYIIHLLAYGMSSKSRADGRSSWSRRMSEKGAYHDESGVATGNTGAPATTGVNTYPATAPA